MRTHEIHAREKGEKYAHKMYIPEVQGYEMHAYRTSHKSAGVHLILWTCIRIAIGRMVMPEGRWPVPNTAWEICSSLGTASSHQY